MLKGLLRPLGFSLASVAVGSSVVVAEAPAAPASPETAVAPVTPPALSTVAAPWTWNTNWDFLEGNKKYGDNPRKYRLLVLVRHGQYEYADTDEERVLTPLGRQQAEKTGARLRKLLDSKKIPMDNVRVVHSTMTRAIETADLMWPFLSGATKKSSDLLREGPPSEFYPAHPSYSPSPYSLWSNGCRIEAGFRDNFHRPRSDTSEPMVDVLVCHGNVIRYYILRALQLPPQAWLCFTLNHASLTTIRISNSGSVAILGIGDSGHFEPKFISSH